MLWQRPNLAPGGVLYQREEDKTSEEEEDEGKKKQWVVGLKEQFGSILA